MPTVIAGLELYLPLIDGGRIELASRECVLDGQLLKKYLQRCKPTMMQATPATWRLLVEAGWRGTPGMIALCGGEILSRDTRLVAYVVPADASFTDLEQLRSFLGERLPEYMLPATYVMLERLPLTPNGKLDRKALPAPEYGRAALNIDFISPRNALETMIAEVWCEVLKLDQVGVHDNFFELGGHSLLALMVSKLSRTDRGAVRA